MQRHFSSSSIQTSQSIENRGYETFEPTTLSIPVKILSHDREERMALLNIHV